MRREFLQNLQAEQPLSKQSIDAIMAENGKDIEATRALFADYDSLKQQLATAQQTIHTLEENADKALLEYARERGKAILDYQHIDSEDFYDNYDRFYEKLCE